jgi:hypothetical protein
MVDCFMAEEREESLFSAIVFDTRTIFWIVNEKLEAEKTQILIDFF